MGRKEFHLVIVSPERTLYEGEVRAVILPGELGKFEVLKDHAPLISSLAAEPEPSSRRCRFRADSRK